MRELVLACVAASIIARRVAEVRWELIDLADEAIIDLTVEDDG